MKLQETVSVVKGRGLEGDSEACRAVRFRLHRRLERRVSRLSRAVEPKLKPRAIIVADNAIRFADEMRDFLDAVSSDAKYQSVIVRASEEKHDGMIVIYRR